MTKRILFYFSILIFSLIYAQLRVKLTFEYEPGSLKNLVAFTARTPFQYRVLIPYFMHFFLKNIKFEFFNLQLYKFLFEALFIFLTALYSYNFLQKLSLNNVNNKILCFLPLFILAFNLIMVPGRNLYYPYDMASVFFFTAEAYYLYKRKFITYYLLFLLATLNRETSIFLVFMFLFCFYGEISFKKLFIHLFLQTLVWFIIKISLYEIFKENLPISPNNPFFANQWKYNIELLKAPSNWLHILGSFGFSWLIVIVFYKNIKNKFIERALFMSIPLLTGMAITGVCIELRIFSEMVPLLSLSIALIINNRLHFFSKG